MPESHAARKPQISRLDGRGDGGARLCITHRSQQFLIDISEIAPDCWSASEIFITTDSGWFDLAMHPLCACAATADEAIEVALAEIEELDEPLELVDPISPEEAARLITSGFNQEAAE